MVPVHLEDFTNDLYAVLEILYTHQIEVEGENYVPLSQLEIAALAGCSRPKINAMMKELIEHGYVTTYHKMRGKYVLTENGLLVVRFFHGEVR